MSDRPPDLGCTLPPEGWYCSIEPGHEGPCAGYQRDQDGLVPVARLRAMVKLLYPEEMTPTAKRQFDLLCEEYK